MTAGEICTTIVREFPFALYGSILVGLICSFLGVYIVAKRVVFLGAVLTQVSVLGLALTFLPVLAMPHTVGSLAVTIVAVILLSRVLTGRIIPKDAILGFIFVFSIAARILVLQKAPKVEASEIENLLRGDILFVTPELFYLMLAVFIVAMTVHLLFYKEFTYISFDAETARTQGYNTEFWEMLFYVIAAVVISVATHMVGDVFVFGFLVIPPVTAMLVARSVRSIFLLSMLMGVLCPALGLFFAFQFDFPSSPSIVAVAAAILGVAFVVAGMGRR
jgi:ABC-type Mn2+/Zn2+ transport system permease subunit